MIYKEPENLVIALFNTISKKHKFIWYENCFRPNQIRWHTIFFYDSQMNVKIVSVNIFAVGCEPLV